jgi:flavodoxin
MDRRSLVLVISYHNKSTEKVAKAIAGTLEAEMRDPRTGPMDLSDYNLVGFGSGIYGGKHHQALLDLAEGLPPVTDKKAFIFSTHGAPGWAMGIDKDGSDPLSRSDAYMEKNHSPLRQILLSKGYDVVGEFSCAGLNTNSFLKFFGGLNKGRPSADDLWNAEEFAARLRCGPETDA